MSTIIAKRGRPSLPGHDINLNISARAASLVEEGARTLSGVTGRTPSKAAWFRALVVSLTNAQPQSLITATDLNDTFPPANSIDQTDQTRMTVRIEESQRVWLRQWECYVQSLDWSRELYRNETVTILIEMQGTSFNLMLATGVTPQ